MPEPSKKPYDLEERTYEFARDVRLCVKHLHAIWSLDDVRQVIRSSGSVGANYIEANEALSKKDFLMRMRICRKEAKETVYWLRLLRDLNPEADIERLSLLMNEATELKKIFSAIIEKSK